MSVHERLQASRMALDHAGRPMPDRHLVEPPTRRGGGSPHDRTTARPHDRTTARPHDRTTARP
ncbi:hypothetical protein V6S75_27950, partial [Burkholderia pseudomallei]